VKGARLLALGGLIGAVGCATAPPVRTSPETAKMTTEDTAQLASRVAGYREEARKLLMQQSELYWRNWVYGDPIDITATYAGHERLFSPEAVADVAKLAALERDPDRNRALGFLRLYLVGEIVGRAVAPLSDKAANLEADATFKTPGGVDQPYRELNRLLANEVNYQLRGQLSDAALPVVRQLNPILEEKERVTRKLLGELGFSSYDAFGAALRQADLTALAKLADDVLTSTEGLYRAAMEKETRGLLGIGLPGMRRADIPRFNRSASLDTYFPANKLIPTLKATLAGMGIDLEKQPNIRIDDAPLPKKNPRAVCFAIVVPRDIRLSVKPLGGVSDYEALFHESGHAEHWAHTQTEAFEFQQLGGNATTEAYAFVLENLLENPRWLEEKVGLTGDKRDAFVHGAAVRKLYMLRRYAGKLLFEIRWHQGAKGSEDPQALYRSVLERAYGFPVSASDAERYLVDHDAFFYSADYFRAWFLAAQIEAHLQKQLGPSWWDSPAAGKALAELWRYGNQLNVDEVAKKLGEPGVQAKPLLDHFQQLLGTRP
jgi:hypothetical protein